MTLKNEMMKTGVKNWVFAGVCILFLAGMFTFPFLSEPSFSLISNTLNDPDARVTPFSWIINSLLVLSAICSLITGWEYYEGFAFHRIILIFFSISLVMCALINQAPFNKEILFNADEYAWHSFLYGTTSLSYIILSLATAIILDKKRERLLTTGAGFTVLVISVITGKWEETDGIWQRVILIIMFGWMIFTFRKKEM